MKSEVAQSYRTLCIPPGCGLLGSSVHGIFQARGLKWVAISFSRDLLNPEIEAGSPALQTDDLPSEPPGKPILLLYNINYSLYLQIVQETSKNSPRNSPENWKLQTTCRTSIIQELWIIIFLHIWNHFSTWPSHNIIVLYFSGLPFNFLLLLELL